MAEQAKDKLEEQRRTKHFIKWKGVFTQASRNAIPEDAWYVLENMQPIGDANIHSIAAASAALYNFTTHPIYWAQYANVGGIDYIIAASTDGNVYAYQIVAMTVSTIGTGFSGSLTRFAQWKNTALLVVDNTFGYGWWTGSGTFTAVTGPGVPTFGAGQANDIAVSFGRVWILTGRLLTFSDANGYVAADFLIANGAGTLNLTDPTIRNTVTRIYAMSGYLYIVSPTSINAISDVYVPSGASPPTPLFTNLNLQAQIGSDQPASFFPMNQALLFANSYGVWALYGTQAQRISSDIDGTWQYRDTTQPVSGGAVVSNNILCSAFLLKKVVSPDPEGSEDLVTLCMFNDGKWWFADYGALTFVTGAIVNNQPALFGFIGNQLYQLFANTASSPESELSTPLWAMEDNLADKEVIRAGFECSVLTFASPGFTMTIDTVNNQYIQTNISSGQGVSWTNSTGFVFGISAFGVSPF